MTLEEASTDLSIQMEVKRRLGKDREANSIKLGIEALIAWRQYRRKKAPANLYLLPGETVED